MHGAKQNQRLLLMCYWLQFMLCTNVPAALNWVGMTVSSICFLAPRKPLCHSLSGRSPSLCCKHSSQKNTHWVLGLASTLTNLSKYLYISPQPEQAFELVWFPSKASGYHTRNHWRKLQQRIWCQALLLLCLSLVPSNLEPFRNKNFNHRSNPSPNVCSKSGVALQSEQTACGLFFEKPAPQSHINLASPPFHNVIDDHFHPSKVTGWSEWCCTAGAHPGQVCQVENPDVTEENKQNIWHSMV